MISRNQGMKLVVNCLFRAVPAVFNVMIVCMLFLLIFAIVGCNYFKGNFYKCDAVDNIYHSDGWWSNEQSNLLVTPLAYSAMSDIQLRALSSLNLTSACTTAYESTYFTKAPTSRWVCECSRLSNDGKNPEWVATLNQNFNNIG